MKKTLIGIGAAFLYVCCWASDQQICLGENGGRIEQWPKADALFQRDPHWRGADDAYSLKLGNGKVLWLFGDTLISSKNKIEPRKPEHVKMPRNTIGIQTGLNPATAKIKFYWGNNNSVNDPKSFFRSPRIAEKNWLWPGDAVLLPDHKTLVVFFMNIMPTDTGLYFDIDGYEVAIVRNSNESPDKWNMEWVKNVSEYLPLKILVGSGGVIVEGKYLYAFGYSSADMSQSVCLARWPLSLFEMKDIPDLSNPEWWCGYENKWQKNNDLNDSVKPAALWNKGQTEFTVNKIKPANSDKSFYLMTESYPQNGFIGNADLVIRTSENLTGPWSEPETLYFKLFRDEPCPDDIMVYAGKYHPELKGGKVIFTYATNTMSLDTLWNYENIYYPRFLKIDCSLLLKNIEEEL